DRPVRKHRRYLDFGLFTERDEINNCPPLTVADAVENSGYRDSQDHNEKNKNQPMPNAQRPHVSPPTSTHTIQRTIEDENLPTLR
ncbi:MAG: hypothetical protein WA679_23275, partial [Pseudolabrys sp.]